MVMLALAAAANLLISCATFLIHFPAHSYWNPPGAPVANLGNTGPHGLSEILYANASAVGTNGSALTGLNANTSWFNLTLGLEMLIGRFLVFVPALALAGNLAHKKRVPVTAGIMPNAWRSVCGYGTTYYGALWQNAAITNLGTLPGDFVSFAEGINNQGQVVGSTQLANGDWSHAFIWQNGVMTDLNTPLPASSNLYATMANKINERGQISGMATVLTGPHAGNIHAYLLTPADGPIGTSMADFARTHPHSILSANACNHHLQRLVLGRLAQ